MFEVRKAERRDLPCLIRIEHYSYGSLGASYETLRERIEILNREPPGWFWVAVWGNRVVASIILQPTFLTPDECTSWEVATDNGTLRQTFSPEGRNVYGVSLGRCKETPPGASDLLIHQGLAVTAGTWKTSLTFSSRMPGYQSYCTRHPDTTPEQYWQLTRADGTPRDPTLRNFTKSLGHPPSRLLPHGYCSDEASGGHAVQFVITDFAIALCAAARRIYRAGSLASPDVKEREYVTNNSQ
jgi:hypothetical protein